MTFELALQGDTGIVGSRYFAAPPARVYTAHVDPDLIRQWMLGPPGWTMPICDWDARPGGAIRCVWANGDERFEVTGHFIALDPPHRMEHVERYHMPDPTPDNHIVTTFEPEGQGTRVRLVMTLPDKDARDAALATGMEEMMELSFARMDAAL
jgi:uncharacterized protein YndB with AHSA1/START domain